MDFLDPSKKRVHKIQLYVGYFLMSIVIGLGTILIFNLTYGYDIDRKTGNLVQNGIIYVDSKPKNGRVFVNDIEQRGSTDTRLVLPAGIYDIRIEVNGFRHWQRTVNLNGHEIKRLLYPYLIPNELNTSDVSTYDVLPTLTSQSPDRRWLLAMNPGKLYEFDVYDMGDVAKASTKVSVPNDVLTLPKSESTIEFVEWSTDNRHVLLKRSYQDAKSNSASEFIVLDKDDPNQTVNINTSLGISPSVVSLKNKRPDQFYYLESVPGILRIADTKARTISAPLIEAVIDYKTYGDDTVLYATQKDLVAGRTDFRIYENGKVYTLKNVEQADTYPMDVSKYENQWYYVVGGVAEGITFVYKNPLPILKKEVHGSLDVKALMRLDNPRFVSFSTGTQFISVQSGSNFLTLDLEKGGTYRFSLGVDVSKDQKIRWMDGHRFVYSTKGQSYIVDFDGSNEQTLVTSLLSPGPFFDRDYDNVFTFEDSKSISGKKALTITVIDPR